MSKAQWKERRSHRRGFRSKWPRHSLDVRHHTAACFSGPPSSLAVRWVTRRREGTQEPRWSEGGGPRPWTFPAGETLGELSAVLEDGSGGGAEWSGAPPSKRAWSLRNRLAFQLPGCPWFPAQLLGWWCCCGVCVCGVNRDNFSQMAYLSYYSFPGGTLFESLETPVLPLPPPFLPLARYS